MRLCIQNCQYRITGLPKITITSTSEGEHTLPIKKLLLPSLPIINPIELKTILLALVLGVRDLHESRPSLVVAGGPDDAVTFDFGFEERADAGDYSDAHFGRVEERGGLGWCVTVWLQRVEMEEVVELVAVKPRREISFPFGVRGALGG